jgi:hypothetical protein
MKLFAHCPVCTVDIWGWQRICSSCAARAGTDVVMSRRSRLGSGFMSVVLGAWSVAACGAGGARSRAAFLESCK